MMPAPSHRCSIATAIVAVAVAVATPTGRAAQNAPATVSIEELWQDPGDITARDLRWGRGGQDLAPLNGGDYKFLAVDATGYSPGYDVVDPSGKKWDVKLGDEAQPEVVVSRVLWAVGYHQPVMYFVPEWKMKGGPETRPRSGRFRLGSDHRNLGDWSWTDNPFRGTRELRGLVVVNLILNNWDLKPSQNRIYGVEGTPSRWFVVQDVGAALGKTSWPTGSKFDIEDFESQNLVKGVENGRVLFDYHARHRELLEDITTEDVGWVCTLLNTITDQQWDELFRHAAIPGETSARYIRKIKSKINEGLALTRTTSAKPS
jgi:hypothetical protein